MDLVNACCGVEEKHKEFVRESIKALEQQPCDDAISREDRSIDLANAIESDDSGYWTNKRISSALRNISSVTQRTNCQYRHENGNCLKVGGFCTSVDDKHCPSVTQKSAESEDKTE